MKADLSLLLRALETAPMITRFLVMVQREVGERLAAGVGDPAYGAVSVRTAWFAEATVVGRVPPSVFLPPPRVESALVRLQRRPAPRRVRLDDPMKAKQLTNVRASGTDEAVRLVPPIALTLESAIEFIAEDELVEITPKTIRIRKRYLNEHDRKRAARGDL